MSTPAASRTAPSSRLPVLVIGAGPVGLAAAANLRVRGMPALVLEAGRQPAAGVRRWGHVRLFSSWDELIDPAARRLLEAEGWEAPDACEHPTGQQWADRYLQPLAAILGDDIRLGHRVTAISRQGRDLLTDRDRDGAPFVVRVDGPEGSTRLLASAVIDASGTTSTPNPLGADGIRTPHELDVGDRVSEGVPDVRDAARAARWRGRHTVVVGRGHTAQNALIALADMPATSVTWLLRGAVDGRTFGGGVQDQIQARGALGTTVQGLVAAGRIDVVDHFRITDVVSHGEGVMLHADDGRTLAADHVVSATGYRPDLSILSELRVDLDPAVQAPRALAPLIDPNVHSCGSVPPHGQAELAHPEPDLYVVGMKSYGRAPTFLALTGYEQVRSVVAHLDGDLEAAAAVKLKLPETGVCGGPGLDVDVPTSDRAESALVATGSACC